MMFLTRSDLERRTTQELNAMYHHAQLAAIAAIVDGCMVQGLAWLDLAIDCRRVCLERFNYDDRGHIEFCERVTDEYLNVRNHISRGTHDYYFQFECGRLVGNAIDAGIYVPSRMHPRGWYYEDYRQSIYA